MFAKRPHVAFKPIKPKSVSQLQPGKVCAIAQASVSNTYFVAFLCAMHQHAALVAKIVQNMEPLHAGNATAKLRCIAHLKCSKRCLHNSGKSVVCHCPD